MSIADQIMKTSDPADHHRLGKKLQLPDDQWNTIISQQVMEEGLTAKFDQNVGLRQKLLDTGNKLLVECNQYDLTWGNGLGIKDGEAHDQTKWKGKNCLGVVLASVREKLK